MQRNDFQSGRQHVGSVRFILQRFRQSELLLEDIPEGEATLMKNGRFDLVYDRLRVTLNVIFSTTNEISIGANPTLLFN